MEPATQTSPSSQTVREAAAAAVTPDPVTAELLAKHAAGEKLDASGYGKIGAYVARGKALLGWKPKASEPASQGAAPADSVAVEPVDPRLVQRTTESILKSCDGIARRYVVSQARLAGADDKTVNRFDSAAALPAGPKELMVESSPEVIAALGLNPKSYPIAAFVGALGIWSTNLWLVIDELKGMQRQNAERSKSQEPTPQTVMPSVTQPGVKRPPDISLPKGPLAFPGGGSDKENK